MKKSMTHAHTLTLLNQRFTLCFMHELSLFVCLFVCDMYDFVPFVFMYNTTPEKSVFKCAKNPFELNLKEKDLICFRFY